MRSRFIAAAVLIPLALGACATGGQNRRSGTAHMRIEDSVASNIPLDWYTLEDAMRLAREQKKPIIVDFYFPEGCSRCEGLATKMYTDPEVADIIKNQFLLVRINLNENMTKEEIALGRKFDYDYNCLMIFLDYRGEVIQDLSGNRMCFPDYIDPAWMKKYLARALEANAEAVKGGG